MLSKWRLLMKSKYLFLLSLAFTSSCYGANPPNPIHYTTLHSIFANTRESKFSSLSELIHFYSQPSHLWFQGTPNVRHGNTLTVSQETTAWQSLSAAARINAFAQNMNELTRSWSNTYHQQIAKLSHEQVFEKIEELKQEIRELEKQFELKLQKASREAQSIIRQKADPLSIDFSTIKSAREQDAFAELMIDLKTIKLKIESVKYAIHQCEQKIADNIAKELKPIVEKSSLEDLVKITYRTLENEIKKIEIAIAQTKGVVDPKIAKELLINQVKLKHIEAAIRKEFYLQISPQRLNDLKYIKENLITLQVDDKQFLTALDKAIREKCDHKFTVHNALRFPEEKLLKELNIPRDNFERFFGDYVHHSFFNKTNSILYDTALRNIQHGDHPLAKEYIDATVRMCDITMKTAKNGSPQDALAACKIMEALHEATGIIIGFTTTPMETAHSAALVKGAVDHFGHNLKGKWEALQSPVETFQGICKSMIRAAAILGEHDQFGSHMLLDKAKIETIVASSNELALTLNKAAKEISAMSSEQIAESLGGVIGDITADALTLKAFNTTLKAINAASTLTVKQAGSVLSKLGSSESLVATQKTLTAASQGLSAAINTKMADITKNIESGKLKFLASTATPKIRTVIQGAAMSVQEAQRLERAMGDVKQAIDKFLAPHLKTPEIQKKVAEYLQKYKQDLNLPKCPNHGVITKQGAHLYVPEDLAKLITNEKDWEKLAKVFDGAISTPAACGEQVAIYSDYQHILGPIIKLDCKKGTVSLSGFHHDFGGKIRQSGALKITGIQPHAHGFYEANWTYGNSKTKPSGFFPDHWTPAQVMNKIGEALQNPVGGAVLNKRSWVMMGKTSEGIKIQINLEFDALNNFNPTGKIISAYPVFK